MTTSLFKLFLMIAGLVLAFSCVKDKPEEPPASNIPFDPAKVLNIKQLKSIFTDSAGAYLFEENYSLFATVVADESSGNIYRTVFVQDSTGGIQLNFLYPGGIYLGDSIRILLNRSTIDEYRGLFQVNNIDQGKNIVKLKNKKIIEPRVITIQELSLRILEFQSTLVRIDDVQFLYSELGETYADSVNKIDVSRTFEQCDGASMIVRSSGYAKFANHTLPEGKGSIIAIATVYATTPQLVIRNASEVKLTGERCSAGGGVDPVPELFEDFSNADDNVDIAFAGWSNVIVAGNRKWRGKFQGNEKYAQATGWQSNLNDMETWLITPPVINTNGDKVLNFKTGMAFWTHTTTTPITVLASNDYEGDFENATWTELSANLVNSGSGNAWVSSGEISLEQFIGNVSVAFKYKGSGTESTTIKVDDVSIKPSSGPPVAIHEADFNDGWDGWQPISIAGILEWSRDNNNGPNGSPCAQMSGFDMGYHINNDWLVSPSLNLSGYSFVTLQFMSARNFDGEDIKIKITTNYTGNPSTTTWTTLNAVLSTGGFSWTDSGAVDISSFNTNGVHIAFEYNSSSTLGATWRVDNITINAK